jgi:hypothetical protein
MDGSWQSCQDQVLPRTELCNNDIDDNCDATIDEDPCVEAACSDEELAGLITCVNSGASIQICLQSISEGCQIVLNPLGYCASESGCLGPLYFNMQCMYENCQQEYIEVFGVPTDGDGDGYYAEINDCNDADNKIHPGAGELCDDIDQNCDGDPAAGSCNDGIACTEDICDVGSGSCTSIPKDEACGYYESGCVSGTCEPTNPESNPEGCVFTYQDEGTTCDDNNLCTQGDTCDGNEGCYGTPITCNDDNPCTYNNCDPWSGCTYNADNSAACVYHADGIYDDFCYNKVCWPEGTTPDADEDGVADWDDNCVSVANPNQADCNLNNVGDACDSVSPLNSEVCDGIDNDCDWGIDEGCDCSEYAREGGIGIPVLCGYNDVNACRTGTQTCNSSTYVWGNCVDFAGVNVTGPTPETCNGEDDDCDGAVDEDGDTPLCPGGQCQGPSGCVVEICNDGIDNDGDYYIDCEDYDCSDTEDCTSFCGDGSCTGSETAEKCSQDCQCTSGSAQSCPLTHGVCTGTTHDCVDGIWTVCNYGSLYEANSETSCDGRDNDCDGAVDEGTGGGSCDTGLLGICSESTTQCQNGALSCVASVEPSPEVCDGLDNDCDGLVDEGGVCMTTCTVDADCSNEYYCSSNACVPKLANGASCTAGDSCFSGYCSDGYCCNSACSGACDSCSYTISGSPNGFCTILLAGSTGSPSCSPNYCNGVSANCPINPVQDPGFEAGPDWANWIQSSTNYVNPITDAASSCSGGSWCSPHSGTYWAWFGGTEINGVQDSIIQDVTIPEGLTTLSFWLEIPQCASYGIDNLKVLIDGDMMFQVLRTDPTCDSSSYTQRNIYITDYANGGTHTIEFRSETYGLGPVGDRITNFFVDDIEIH